MFATDSKSISTVATTPYDSNSQSHSSTSESLSNAFFPEKKIQSCKKNDNCYSKLRNSFSVLCSMSEPHVEFPHRVNNLPPKRERAPSNVLPMLLLEVVVWHLLKGDSGGAVAS
ncbi:hypothetical protein SLEP1_g56842 [Rubroshorea leprosula]|uniref:Uncharacterized protein n=1 Tax=Rubroshorea leprosula TaxID=152421 RepID=A0AAV5MKP9_9ROSI|nr:hypothetical protein SLEP1_g56842 [Rubroshorea leprosula]